MSTRSLLPRRLLPASLVIALLLLVPSLHAGSVLPAHSGKWTASNAVQSPAIPADAKDILTESGLESAETRAYSNGNAAITVAPYRLYDSSGAYEAYTFFQEPKSGCGPPAPHVLMTCMMPADDPSRKRR